ncbi:HPr family phosphocarrier protein [uncultured Tyzzerella sp.]|uniref:HPr family phosphocarrier protein n=1 Tax=uncultured Tyzzerella sp. TaxID=2321398 RepID=UPI0029432BE0|nr:HPr family phosphocarrier protein [uncultured Tyzzerella sp.]
MKCFNILLDTVDKVKEFSGLINKFDGDFDLTSNDYVIDAKSIMGIFSLDLKNPLKLEVNNVSNIEDLEISLKKFM